MIMIMVILSILSILLIWKSVKYFNAKVFEAQNLLLKCCLDSMKKKIYHLSFSNSIDTLEKRQILIHKISKIKNLKKKISSQE